VTLVVAETLAPGHYLVPANYQPVEENKLVTPKTPKWQNKTATVRQKEIMNDV
jgi:hypothetical protein